MADSHPVATIVVDPRLFDAVVDFTTEVADVAASLCNLGLGDECRRLTSALDRLDDAQGDDDVTP